MLFSQVRYGLNEQKFRCWKFRSMYVQPDPHRHPGRPTPSEPWRLLKMKNDSRVTPAGRWLRRTSVDELPQLINVLRGDMSVVGPRPLVLPMLDSFPEIRRVRCLVRPGITGLWQIRNRERNLSIFDMLSDDAEYIANVSLRLDLLILLRTVPAVLSTKGAH